MSENAQDMERLRGDDGILSGVSEDDPRPARDKYVPLTDQEIKEAQKRLRDEYSASPGGNEYGPFGNPKQAFGGESDESNVDGDNVNTDPPVSRESDRDGDGDVIEGEWWEVDDDSNGVASTGGRPGGVGSNNARNSGEGGRGDGTPPPPDGGNGERKEDDDEEPLEEPYWGTPFNCDICADHNDGGLKCGSCHGVRKDVRDNPEIMRDIQNFEGEYYAAMDALAEDGDVGLLIDWMAEYGDRGYVNYSVRRNVMREIRRSGRYDEYVGKRDEVRARRASRVGGNSDNGGNEQVRVEIPIGQAREVFMERVHQVLFFTEGDIKVVRPEDVDRILREIGAPEVFRKEAYAFAAIMNQSGIKRHFSDNPKPLFDQLDKVDLQAAPVGDVEKIRLMLHGYQDRYWLDMLAAQDPRAKENISQAWMWFSYIGEGDDRGVPAGQEWLSAYIQEYGEKGVKNQEFEDGMVRRVAGMLGISEYEARVAFMCWEATMESEVNKKHPFYGLTHPIEHAEGLRTHSRIWWGSEGWWRVPDVKGGRINGMPARLWRPVGYGGGNGVGIAERVLTGSGVEAFLHDLQDRSRRRGEGLFDGNLRDLMTIAAKAHKRLTDIGPGTPTAKFEPKMLWGLKESLSTLVSKGYVGMDEAKRALEAASMVYFYEMSVEAPNYDKVEDRVLRVMSPAAMMRKFMDLALLGEDLVVDGGNWRVVERGLFDFGDGDEGLDRLRRVRGLAWGYMREFYDNRRYWHLLPDNQNQKGIMGSLKFGMVTDYIENQQELYRLLKKADKKNPRAWLSDRWGLT